MVLDDGREYGITNGPDRQELVAGLPGENPDANPEAIADTIAQPDWVAQPEPRSGALDVPDAADEPITGESDDGGQAWPYLSWDPVAYRIPESEEPPQMTVPRQDEFPPARSSLPAADFEQSGNTAMEEVAEESDSRSYAGVFAEPAAPVENIERTEPTDDHPRPSPIRQIQRRLGTIASAFSRRGRSSSPESDVDAPSDSPDDGLYVSPEERYADILRDQEARNRDERLNLVYIDDFERALNVVVDREIAPTFTFTEEHGYIAADIGDELVVCPTQLIFKQFVENELMHDPETPLPSGLSRERFSEIGMATGVAEQAVSLSVEEAIAFAELGDRILYGAGLQGPYLVRPILHVIRTVLKHAPEHAAIFDNRSYVRPSISVFSSLSKTLSNEG